jgi:hypothetical protein
MKAKKYMKAKNPGEAKTAPPKNQQLKRWANIKLP